MILQTERLTIRELSVTDTRNIHELHSLPETDEFNTLGIPATIQATEIIVDDWLNKQKQNPGNSFVFCIERTDANQFIGLIALVAGKQNYRTAEVWYKIHRDHWGKGYATEALKEVVGFGFTELSLHRIEAGCAVENIASVKVLEKAGLQREGRKIRNLPVRGEWKDSYFYAIAEEDFLK